MRNVAPGCRARDRSLCATLALGATVALIAGCGSSRSSSASAAAGASNGSAGSLLSEGELIARADAICTRVNNEIADVKPVGLNAQRIASVAPAHALIEQTGVNQLERLEPPASMATDWQRIIALRRRLATELDQLANAADSEDMAGIRGFAASKLRVHHQLSALAKRDGFRVCGQVG